MVEAREASWHVLPCPFPEGARVEHIGAKYSIPSPPSLARRDPSIEASMNRGEEVYRIIQRSGLTIHVRGAR